MKTERESKRKRPYYVIDGRYDPPIVTEYVREEDGDG